MSSLYNSPNESELSPKSSNAKGGTVLYSKRMLARDWRFTGHPDHSNTNILTRCQTMSFQQIYQPINYGRIRVSYLYTCIHSDTRSTLLRCFFNQDPHNDMTALFDVIVHVSGMFLFPRCYD